jgi:hypothetical protein
MKLQLAENRNTLDKASEIINSIQAVKNIPFVGQALQIANGLVGILNAKEKAAFEKTLEEARKEPLKWWINEGKVGNPYQPDTKESQAWLVSRLGSAVQSVSKDLIGLRPGTGKVSKARWVKAYQTMLDEILKKQEKANAPLIPGLPFTTTSTTASSIKSFLPIILGGALVLYFITKK